MALNKGCWDTELAGVGDAQTALLIFPLQARVEWGENAAPLWNGDSRELGVCGWLGGRATSPMCTRKCQPVEVVPSLALFPWTSLLLCLSFLPSCLATLLPLPPPPLSFLFRARQLLGFVLISSSPELFVHALLWMWVSFPLPAFVFPRGLTVNGCVET